MARTSLGCQHWDPKLVIGAKINTCLSKDSSNVYVSMEVIDISSFESFYSNWKMELQRKQGPHPETAWKTVGTRTGYISDTSPSNRTFTNVGQPGSHMRVMVHFDAPNKTFFFNFVR